MEILNCDKLLLALWQSRWVGRRLADTKVIDPAITHVPALVLSSVCRWNVVVLDNHLARQEINLVAEIFVLGIVNPKYTTHSSVLKIAQAEIIHPEILLQKGSERNAIVLEHIQKSLFGYILVKYAIGVVVGVGVLLNVGLLFHNVSVLALVILSLAPLSEIAQLKISQYFSYLQPNEYRNSEYFFIFVKS